MKKKYITDFYLFDLDKKFLDGWCMIKRDNKSSGKIIRGKSINDLREKQKPGFDYAFFQFAGPRFYTPIDLYNPKTMERITILGIIDSGASLCAFNYQIAEAIGINWKKGKKMKAVQGEIFTALYAYRVKMLMGSPWTKKIWPIEADIFDAKRSVNLLGVEGFFDHCEILFRPSYGPSYRFI